MNDSAPNQKQGKTQSGSDGEVHGKNAVEWSVFALSCVLVTLVLGYLTFLTLTNQSSTPQLRATLGQPIERDGQIWIPVKVENRGMITANNVEIEVEHGDKSAGFTLPHVPRQGEREGWVGFDPPLQRDTLKARVSGYQTP